MKTNRHILQSAPQPQSGFTLLETLIASFVVAFSLMGLAVMQVNALRTSHNAFFESRASLLAYELIELVRENDSAVSSYLVDSKNFNCNQRSDSNLCSADTFSKAACTETELAQHDIFIAICGYKKDNYATGGIREAIPNGRLVVQCIAADGSLGADCSENQINVNVTWLEQNLIKSLSTDSTRSLSINGKI